MATHRNTQSNSTIGGTTVTVTAPTGVQEDDLLLVALATSSNSGSFTAGLPAGWSIFVVPSVKTSSGTLSTSSTTGGAAIAWKRATSSEPADYTFTCSVSGNLIGIVSAYDNVNFQQWFSALMVDAILANTRLSTTVGPSATSPPTNNFGYKQVLGWHAIAQTPTGGLTASFSALSGGTERARVEIASVTLAVVEDLIDLTTTVIPPARTYTTNQATGTGRGWNLWIGDHAGPHDAREFGRLIVDYTLYTMRAYNTALSRYVYWSVADNPDTTGLQSGYSVSDLTDVVTVHRQTVVDQ